MPFKDPIKQKEYQKEYSKIHYLKNKNKYKARAKVSNKKARKKNKHLVNTYKLNKGCSVCGYNKCYAALDFHHVDEKKENISIMARQSYSWNNIQKEIDKCIVICSNCHRELHVRECGEIGETRQT